MYTHSLRTCTALSIITGKCVLLRHTEDMELHSLNYLHYGALKVWYCVSPTHKKKMDAFVASRLYAQHGQCKNFMRHKVKYTCQQLLHVRHCGSRHSMVLSLYSICCFFLFSAFTLCHSC